MSSEVSFSGSSFWISNRIARHLVEFAIERGAELASNDLEADEVGKLSSWYSNQYWNGICLELELLFPTTASRSFWARVFQAASSTDFTEQERLDRALEIGNWLLAEPTQRDA